MVFHWLMHEIIDHIKMNLDYGNRRNLQSEKNYSSHKVIVFSKLSNLSTLMYEYF